MDEEAGANASNAANAAGPVEVTNDLDHTNLGAVARRVIELVRAQPGGPGLLDRIADQAAETKKKVAWFWALVALAVTIAIAAAGLVYSAKTIRTETDALKASFDQHSAELEELAGKIDDLRGTFMKAQADALEKVSKDLRGIDAKVGRVEGQVESAQHSLDRLLERALGGAH